MSIQNDSMLMERLIQAVIIDQDTQFVAEWITLAEAFGKETDLDYTSENWLKWLGDNKRGGYEVPEGLRRQIEASDTFTEIVNMIDDVFQRGRAERTGNASE